MFKKITVLAMALGALAAFAIPMPASANWKHGQNDVTEEKTITVTGTDLAFQSPIGGVRCQTTSGLIFYGSSTTGTVEQFNPDEGQTTERCVGTGGLAFCQIHELTPTERVQDPTVGSHTDLRWTVHTTPASGQTPAQITVTNGQIHSTGKGAFCTAHKITLDPGTVHFTVDNVNNVSTAQLSGALQGTITSSPSDETFESIHTTVSGTIHVEGQDAGTYGL